MGGADLHYSDSSRESRQERGVYAASPSYPASRWLALGA